MWQKQADLGACQPAKQVNSVFTKRLYLNKTAKEVIVKVIPMSAFGCHTHLYRVTHLYKCTLTYITQKTKNMQKFFIISLKLCPPNKYFLINSYQVKLMSVTILYFGQKTLSFSRAASNSSLILSDSDLIRVICIPNETLKEISNLMLAIDN